MVSSIVGLMVLLFGYLIAWVFYLESKDTQDYRRRNPYKKADAYKNPYRKDKYR